MCLARHKGRKKTLALPNRPKPFGVVRSLTDEFVKRENWKLETGNWERDPPMGPVGGVPVAQERDPPNSHQSSLTPRSFAQRICQQLQLVSGTNQLTPFLTEFPFQILPIVAGFHVIALCLFLG